MHQDWLPPWPFHLLKKLDIDRETGFKKLGPYLITKRTAGYGTFAHVKKAIHKETSHVFAVKRYNLGVLQKKRRLVSTINLATTDLFYYKTALEDLYEGVRILHEISQNNSFEHCETLYDIFLLIQEPKQFLNYKEKKNSHRSCNSKLYLVVDFFGLGPVMVRNGMYTPLTPKMTYLPSKEQQAKSHSHYMPLHFVLTDVSKDKMISGKQNGHNVYEFSEELIKCFLRDIALAVKSLHDNGFVHRDIKPDNIFMEENGRLKLGDFSLATSIDSTVHFSTVGTYAFFSPELCEGRETHANNYNIAQTTDIWALGVTAWIFFYGTLPFCGESCEELFDMIRFSSPTHRQDIHLSDQARNCLDCLLEKNPLDRLTASQLLNHAFLEKVNYNAAYHYAQAVSKQRNLNNIENIAKLF